MSLRYLIINFNGELFLRSNIEVLMKKAFLHFRLLFCLCQEQEIGEKA